MSGPLTRRAAVVGGLGACACGLLSACAGGGGDARAVVPAASAASGTVGADAGPAPAPQATSGPHPVPISQIPVGGSLVVMVDAVYPVAVAQPTAGHFTAHTAICTHKGCTVKTGQGLELDCPCHGSRFDAATGRVLGSPATRPLQPWPFTVQGDQLVLHAHESSYDHPAPTAAADSTDSGGGLGD